MADKEVKIKITADSKELSSGLKKATSSLGRFAKTAGSGVKGITGGITKFAKTSLGALGSLGKGIVAIGTVYTGTLIGIAKAYSSYEKALVGVGKTANISGNELQKFGKEFKEATKDIPVATNELLGFAKIGAQLGVANEDLTKFSTTLARLQVSAEGLNMEDAALSIARSVKLIEGNTKNVDKFASVVARLGDEFPITEGEILHSSLNIASAISRFGVSTAQVTALATATKSSGIEAENARSQIATAFNTIGKAISKGGKKFEELQRLTGMTGEQLKKTFKEDATEVFTAFLGGLNQLETDEFNQSLETMGFTGIRANQVIGSLATKGFDTLTTALSTANDEYGKNTKLTNESSKAFGTLGSLTTLVWKRITDLTSAVGEKLAPAFKSIAKRATAFFDSMSDTKTVDAISDAFLIMMGIGEDAIKGIAGVGKSILKWFGGDGDVSKSLKTFRSLLEMGNLWNTLKLVFKRALIDIEIAFDEFLKSIGKKISDFFSTDFSKDVAKSFGNVAKTLGINLPDVGKEIPKLKEGFNKAANVAQKGFAGIKAIAQEGFDVLSGGGDKSEGKSLADKIKENFSNQITAINEGTQAKNEAATVAFESEKEKTLTLQEQSDELTRQIEKNKEEAYKRAKEKEEEDKEDEDEEEDGKRKFDLLGDPEKNQELIDENTEIQESGFSRLFDGIKSFFTGKSGVDKKDSKEVEAKGKVDISTAQTTFGALESLQSAFGEKNKSANAALAVARIALGTVDAWNTQQIPGDPSSLGRGIAAAATYAAANLPQLATIKGAKQEGGAVTGGDSFLVGERGAEVFTPQVDGNIIPNDALGGQTVQVVVTGGDDFARTLNYDIQDQKELGTVAK